MTPLSRCFRNCLRIKRRSRRPRLLRRNPRANGRNERAHLLQIPRIRNIPTLSHPSLHLKRRVIQRSKRSTQSKRISKLKQRLEAFANQKGFQEAGVVRPYPVEWDLVPYSPKFKAPTLHAFDVKGSPNQHIYYFKSQTENVVSNDVILSCLFIGTLKGIAFE